MASRRRQALIAPGEVMQLRGEWLHAPRAGVNDLHESGEGEQGSLCGGTLILLQDPAAGMGGQQHALHSGRADHALLMQLMAQLMAGGGALLAEAAAGMEQAQQGRLLLILDRDGRHAAEQRGLMDGAGIGVVVLAPPGAAGGVAGADDPHPQAQAQALPGPVIAAAAGLHGHHRARRQAAEKALPLAAP